ncbi:MAG: carboxymuconolactone decarboxylase family protein [Planctomycetes bacterium]|nr:carboxymuconolactone decarboxylase family protein [Planctomycetota bacterium]MCB9888664.1 carboxymuconolactone decarboxylase family protein [Planctomycetota bacterium]
MSDAHADQGPVGRDLDLLLRRPGLEPEVRLLVVAKVAVWPGDEARLTEACTHGRRLGMPRSQIEEVLLQAVLFCGFPRVVNAFQTLRAVWPAPTPPAGGGLPEAEQRAAGEALFHSIYGANTDAVLGMLRDCHHELHEFVLDTAYGRILTRPGLRPAVRELLAAGILAHTGQIPQLVAHGRGALALGATAAQLGEAIYTGTGDAASADGLMRRIARS